MQRGFTLIELLVVVLIIGILAAIALPQYQRAVMRSRIMATLPNVRALVNAVDLHYLYSGALPTTVEATNDFDIKISGGNWTFDSDQDLEYVITGQRIRYVITKAGLVYSQLDTPAAQTLQLQLASHEYARNHSDTLVEGQARCVANKNNDTAVKICESMPRIGSNCSNSGDNLWVCKVRL